MAKDKRKVLQHLQKLAKMIDLRTPVGSGFILMVFPFNKLGTGSYVSNAKHEDVPRLLRKFADHLEKRDA